MTEQDFINSPVLGQVILNLIAADSSFKDALKATASPIAADIESASTNPNCSCRNKVLTYINLNTATVGLFLYNFAIAHNILQNVENIFNTTTPPITGQPASGRVAKTTIKNWPEFAKGVQQANLSFKHMSTSIVGEDVYVFFL